MARLRTWRYAFQPKINLFGRRKDNWHRLGMNGRHDGVGSCRGPGRWVFGKDGSIVVPIKGNLQANNGDALLAAAHSMATIGEGAMMSAVRGAWSAPAQSGSGLLASPYGPSTL
jgi:hypothetical protein